jgi:hypothetical protein
MKDTLVKAMQPLFQKCFDILKRDDIKKEAKILLKPIVDFVFREMNQYIYIIISLLFSILIINLVILVILLLLLHNNNNIFQKIFYR